MTRPTGDDDSDTRFDTESHSAYEQEKGPAAGLQIRRTLSRDDLFHVLQSRRRRLALWYLHEHAVDGEASVRAVARHVAAVEAEQSVADVDDGEAQRVHLSLCQAHLHKLESVGVIEYDDARGIVRLTDLVDVFAPYLTSEPSEFAVR